MINAFRQSLVWNDVKCHVIQLFGALRPTYDFTPFSGGLLWAGLTLLFISVFLTAKSSHLHNSINRHHHDLSRVACRSDSGPDHHHGHPLPLGQSRELHTDFWLSSPCLFPSESSYFAKTDRWLFWTTGAGSPNGWPRALFGRTATSFPDRTTPWSCLDASRICL